MDHLKQKILSFIKGQRIQDNQNTTAEFFGVDESDFLEALFDLYKSNKISLDNVLCDFGIDLELFLDKLALRFDLIYRDKSKIQVDYHLCEKIPAEQLKRLEILPLSMDEKNLYVAFKNPFNLEAREKISNIFHTKFIKIVISDPSIIDKHIQIIKTKESIKAIVAEIRKEINSSSKSSKEDSSAIVKLINMILTTSIKNRASDIHIEPLKDSCIVRNRIDGMLTEAFLFDSDIYPPLLSRIKLLANIDITERRKPQDGRFSMTVLGKDHDFRISTLPVMNGESLVMRILDKSKVIVNLENLGMNQDNFTKFKSSLHSPYGIILVTGPTGSGKTTTLYAALNEIKSMENKVITVEDPVEYQLDMIQQVNVNEKVGLTFASALRSILRQDPNIIMVGEIRDQETLKIAIQAALTGHLVFSTVHTNDSISAIDRLVDMGVEGYLVGGCVVAIEAQRLVRKLCPHCKQKTTISGKTLEKIGKYINHHEFYRSIGCDMCLQTGFIGREMISEILLIDDEISSLIAKGASRDEIAKVAYKNGFMDMFSDGIQMASKGITTIEEVFRVAKV